MTVKPNQMSRRLTDLSDPRGAIPGSGDGYHAQPERPEGPENFDDEPVPERTGRCRSLGDLLWGSGANAVFDRR
jgi:hypothetical protein